MMRNFEIYLRTEVFHFLHLLDIFPPPSWTDHSLSINSLREQVTAAHKSLYRGEEEEFSAGERPEMMVLGLVSVLTYPNAGFAATLFSTVL